jgi:hypothetical protein
MQPQFGSVSLVAATYERELRADAARVRSVQVARTGRNGRRVSLGWCGRAVGLGLVRLASCVTGSRRVSLGNPVPSSRNVVGPTR